MMRSQRCNRAKRIWFALPETVTEGRRGELRGVVYDCAARIERELGTLERWSVRIVPRVDRGFSGAGADALSTIWKAMYRLKPALDARVSRLKPALDARVGRLKPALPPVARARA
ncbi:MAG: hypothetical protein M3680_05760 [Myxococcota bacterium]|nr:hypothetical protein [Myxococcota bacterium]